MQHGFFSLAKEWGNAGGQGAGLFLYAMKNALGFPS